MENNLTVKSGYVSVRNARISTKNRMRYQNGIAALICLSVFLQYIFLVVDALIGEGGGIVIDIFKMSGTFIYIVIAALSMRNTKTWRLIVALLLCAFIIVRTIFIYGVFNLIFINVPVIITIAFASDVRLNKKHVKSIFVCSFLCFLVLFLTSRYDGSAYYVNRIIPALKINRNELSFVATILFYMALSCLTKNDRRIRPSYVITYIVALAVIYLSGSRTALGCAVITVIFHIISVKAKYSKKRKLTVFFLLCITVSFFSAIIIKDILSPILNNLYDGRSFFSSREILYSDAIGVLSKNNDWLFGFGFEQFSDLGNSEMVWAAHNQWLQFTLNYGILFALAIYLIFCKNAVKAIAECHSAKSMFFILMTIVILIFFATETVFFTYYRTFVCLTFFFTNYREVQRHGNHHKASGIENLVDNDA